MLRMVILSVLVSLIHPFCVVAGSQVSHLQVEHRNGQTFLTWREVAPDSLPESLSIPQLKNLRAQLVQKQGIEYLVYRSSRPITSLNALTPVAKIEPLSGWNAEFYGVNPGDAHQAFRYILQDGAEPLQPGLGLYVHAPEGPGDAYYAVTHVLKGREDKTLSPGNSLRTPVRETNGPGFPVLQRVVKPEQFQYIPQPTLHYYVRWENPPNSNVIGKAFDYLVAVPPNLVEPAALGIHLHSWGANLNGGYGWWYNAEKGAMLISTNQIPYDWWTGYHEHLHLSSSSPSPVAWEKGVVRPYTQRRLLSFLEWVATQWPVDLSRTFVAGNSMGGSGSLMLAIRYPDRIAWAISWVGIHIPHLSPQFKKSYKNVYGDPGLKVRYEDGTPVWDYFNDVWFLKRYPQKEVGFLTFSNGKNDGGIGWKQAVEFYQALQDTKRPHMFVWGQAGHGQRAGMPMRWENYLARQGRNMPIDIRTDQSLPSFTNSSLDDNPGNGDPQDGDPAGQVNAHLYWETEDIVDEPDRWEMTIGVGPDAPSGGGTVDVTPRRCQQFQVQSGQKVAWKNERGRGGKTLQSGEVTADQWGLVTLPDVQVGTRKNRLSIWKSPDS